MKEISPIDFRVMMMDILQDVQRFCDEKGLRYYLSYGSLLGTVRHKGYIPWDDDIDIWMPRPDYQRLMAEYDHPYYKVLSAWTDKDYPLDFAKVHDTRTMVVEDGGDGNWGVFIDIWILDGIHSPEEGKKIMKKVSFYRGMVANQRFTRKFKIGFKTGLKKSCMALMGKIVHPFVSLQRILQAEDRFIGSNDYESCPYVSSLVDWKYQIFLPKEALEPFVMMPFEDREFRCPADSHQSLIETFGPNYMTPPPEEKRYSVHECKAYWK